MNDPFTLVDVSSCSENLVNPSKEADSAAIYDVSFSPLLFCRGRESPGLCIQTSSTSTAFIHGITYLCTGVLY